MVSGPDDSNEYLLLVECSHSGFVAQLIECWNNGFVDHRHDFGNTEVHDRKRM